MTSITTLVDNFFKQSKATSLSHRDRQARDQFAAANASNAALVPFLYPELQMSGKYPCKDSQGRLEGCTNLAYVTLMNQPGTLNQLKFLRLLDALSTLYPASYYNNYVDMFNIGSPIGTKLQRHSSCKPGEALSECAKRLSKSAPSAVASVREEQDLDTKKRLAANATRKEGFETPDKKSVSPLFIIAILLVIFYMSSC